LIGKLDLDTMKVELEKEPKIIKKEDYWYAGKIRAWN
jgi:hypothetical protein